MSKDYTRFDWARDQYDLARWIDEEERLIEWIDRPGEKRNKRTRNNKKNHRNYA